MNQPSPFPKAACPGGRDATIWPGRWSKKDWWREGQWWRTEVFSHGIIRLLHFCGIIYMIIYGIIMHNMGWSILKLLDNYKVSTMIIKYMLIYIYICVSIFKLVGGFYIGWAIQNRPQPSSWDLNVKQNETPVEIKLASQNPKGTSKTMFDKISTKKQIQVGVCSQP